MGMVMQRQRNDALWRFSRLGIASFQRMLRFQEGLFIEIAS